MSEKQKNKNNKRISSKTKEFIAGITLATVSVGLVGANLPTGERPTLSAAAESSAPDQPAVQPPEEAEIIITPEMAQEAEQIRMGLTANMNDLSSQFSEFGTAIQVEQDKGGLVERSFINGPDGSTLTVEMFKGEGDQLEQLSLISEMPGPEGSARKEQFSFSPTHFSVSHFIVQDGQEHQGAITSYQLEDAILHSYHQGAPRKGPGNSTAGATQSAVAASLDNFDKAFRPFQERIGELSYHYGIETI